MGYARDLHVTGCCQDPICSLKLLEVRRDLAEAKEKIEALKLRLVEWHTINRLEADQYLIRCGQAA